MNNSKGITLVELLVVVAVASVALLASAAYAIPWLAREGMRSAVYDVQTYMRLARIEAVSRNRPCRFVINTDSHQLQVYDANGTIADSTDDLLLYETTLPDSVAFARPGVGAAVTLSSIGSSTYESRFGADGVVEAGTGEVNIFGGNRYGRVQIFGAGGIQVQRWDGSAWAVGS